MHPKRATNTRWIVLLGLSLASTCAYLSRVCLSTANTSVQREFGLSTETMGQILAAFSVGYFWFQIPGGWLGGRWGVRLALPFLCILWSLSSIWTGLSSGSVGLWFSRMTSGVAQAGLVPVSALAITNWFPAAERGASSSAVATCMTAGSVIATFLTALLLPRVGWRAVFAIYAAVGLMWSLAFYLGFRNRPEEHPAVNDGELKTIRFPGLPQSSGGTGLPQDPVPACGTVPLRGAALALALFGCTGLWWISLQAFCRAFGAAFFITWFPTYLEKGRGLVPMEAGLLTTLPLVGTLIGNALGGWVVDRLLARTGSARVSRCGTSVAALLLSAASLFCAGRIGHAATAVVVIALGSICFGISSPASWAACMDLGGRQTPLVMAIQNMTGNLGAFVCPIILGVLIGHIERTRGDWNQVLHVFVAIYMLGALFWFLVDPNQRIPERQLHE